MTLDPSKRLVTDEVYEILKLDDNVHVLWLEGPRGRADKHGADCVEFLTVNAPAIFGHSIEVTFYGARAGLRAIEPEKEAEARQLAEDTKPDDGINAVLVCLGRDGAHGAPSFLYLLRSEDARTALRGKMAARGGMAS